jgi:hypothetical protein
MEIWTRKGVTEFCPKVEYLEDVIREAHWIVQRETMIHDRFFDATVALKNSKIKLVWGDARRIEFRFDLVGRKHRSGERYAIYPTAYPGPGPELAKVRPVKRSKDLFDCEPPDPTVGIPSLPDLTGKDLLNAINELLIEEVLSL